MCVISVILIIKKKGFFFSSNICCILLSKNTKDFTCSKLQLGGTLWALDQKLWSHGCEFLGLFFIFCHISAVGAINFVAEFVK